MKKSIKIINITLSDQFEDCCHNGHYEVIYEDGKTNPYRIIKTWFENGRRHQKQLVRYGDITSVMWYFWELTTRY